MMSFSNSRLMGHVWTHGILLKALERLICVPMLRHLLLKIVSRHLRSGYERIEENPVRLHCLKWFGKHLETFLERLVRERPAAARAMVRFLVTWAHDVERRAALDADGVPTPSTVVIEPTDRCNLNCPGCYARSTRYGSDVPFERLAQIVEQVIDMGVTLVTLSGGEPFLREKKEHVITRLAGMFPERGFLVYTNGTLIDRSAARRLGEAGNVFPAISVEGFEHQTDARRGRGVYGRNRRSRRWLREAGVMTGFSATVTRENAESIAADEFIDLRIEEGDLFGWFFLLQPIGRSPRPDLMVTADQRAMLREAIYRWRAQNRPIFLGDFWNDGHLAGGCIAGGTAYFHIYANGDISPCVFSPVACGNVYDVLDGKSEYKSLSEFVGRHPFFVGVRAKQGQITERRAPCMLIDHPGLFRELCAQGHFRPGKNMPASYLEGEIGDFVSKVAGQWQDKLRELPELPECVGLEAETRGHV